MPPPCEHRADHARLHPRRPNLDGRLAPARGRCPLRRARTRRSGRDARAPADTPLQHRTGRQPVPAGDLGHHGLPTHADTPGRAAHHELRTHRGPQPRHAVSNDRKRPHRGASATTSPTGAGTNCRALEKVVEANSPSLRGRTSRCPRCPWRPDGPVGGAGGQAPYKAPAVQYRSGAGHEDQHLAAGRGLRHLRRGGGQGRDPPGLRIHT